MIETTKCEYCYHYNVCKFREDFEKESQSLLKQAELKTTLEVEIRCKNYVNGANVILHTTSLNMTYIPDKPYEITCTNAYSDKEI